MEKHTEVSSRYQSGGILINLPFIPASHITVAVAMKTLRAPSNSFLINRKYLNSE